MALLLFPKLRESKTRLPAVSHDCKGKGEPLSTERGNWGKRQWHERGGAWTEDKLLLCKRDKDDVAVDTGPLLALAVGKRKSPSYHFSFL